MPKTIRELADELNVSKQTIQYHYQRLPTENQQKNSQGTNMISLTAERIIRGKVTKPLCSVHTSPLFQNYTIYTIHLCYNSKIILGE